MLDENLPTYHFKPSTDSPLHTILYFTHNGSDSAATYILMRADPALPQAKNKYAVALTEASSQSIIYAESLVEPSWTQPTLSQAEIRANNGVPPPATPVVPDTVTLDLYNPDSQVVIRSKPGSWGKSDSWEFELPEQSFRAPSASMLDRDAEASAPPIADVVPKVVFRWKKESRLGKEMTCYMVGRSVDGRKSKEPDITIAMFKESRHGGSTVTIYEPNLRRVDVQDRKGLDIVLLLGAEVVRDVWLNPKPGLFNTGASPPPTAGRRKDSRGQSSSPVGGPTMSGAMGATPQPPPTTASAVPPSRKDQHEIDAETRRLQAMVAEEERQARERERQARERERQDAEEARRIKAMLDQEENERRRKQAEVEAETERLRRQYGVQGQAYSGGPSPMSPEANVPGLPPRPGGAGRGTYFATNNLPHPSPPPRPVSAGPSGAQMSGGSQGWWKPTNGGSGGGGGHQHSASGGAGAGGKKPSSNPLSGLLGSGGVYGNPAASVSNFFARHRDQHGEGQRPREVDGDDGRKLTKKRSTHF